MSKKVFPRSADNSVFTFIIIIITKNLFRGKSYPCVVFEISIQVTLYSRVKKEHIIYIKKKKGTGGGRPSGPSGYTVLTTAAADLTEAELEYTEKCYERMAFEPDDWPAYSVCR